MYLQVTEDYSNLYITEILDDKKLMFRKMKYKPEIFIDSTDENSEFKSLIDNSPVRKIKFKSIVEYKNYVRDFKNVNGIKLFNMIDSSYQYIREQYLDNRTITESRFWYLDIETDLGPNNSFPDPLKAEAPITLIQVAESDSDTVYVFGWKMDYKPTSDEYKNLKYLYCKNEVDMLSKFIEFYHLRTPSITTAHFGDNFDFPFIINRLKNLGMDTTLFSPFDKNEKHRVVIFGKDSEIEKPLGMYWLDFVECFKKAIPGGQESFGLDYLSKMILGDEIGGKLNIKDAGYRTTKELVLNDYDPNLVKDKESEMYKIYMNGEAHEMNPRWNQLHYSCFVQYAYEDVLILKLMDKKLNTLNALISLAHAYGSNVYDVFATIKPWQIFIHNSIYKNKKVLPAKSEFDKYSIPGGHVFAKPGLHEWVISEDYTSLYPFIAMSLNISPETYILYKDVPDDLKEATKSFYRHPECEDIYIALPESEKEYIASLLRKYNFTMSANGVFFTKDFYGIFPTLNKTVYLDRKKHKKTMKDAERKIEEIEKELHKSLLKDELLKELKTQKQIANQENTLQYTKKIQINSGYGFFTASTSMIANSDAGAAITAYGRVNIKMTTKYVIDNINKMNPNFSVYVLQIDTDAMYISLESVVNYWKKSLSYEPDVHQITEFCDQFIKKFIQPLIDESSEKIAKLFNAYENSLKMDRECIPYNGVIEMSFGKIKIGDLVNECLPSIPDDYYIKSFNHKTLKTEYKKVVNVMKHKTKERLLTISNGDYTFKCTENHKVAIHNNGNIEYKEAKFINENDELIIDKNKDLVDEWI